MIAGPHPAAVARTTDEARAGRSIAERVAFRLPSLTRRLARVVLERRKLPGREALIRHAYRRVYAAYNRRDWELNTLLHHPEDYVLRAGGMGLLMPDAADEYHGIDGYLEANLQFESAWRDLRVRFEDMTEVESGLIVSTIRYTALAQGSGTRMEQPSADVQRIRDGLLVEQTFYWHRAEAFASVGLRPPTTRR